MPRKEKQGIKSVSYIRPDLKVFIGLRKEFEFYYKHHLDKYKLFLSHNSISKVLRYFPIISNFPYRVHRNT